MAALGSQSIASSYEQLLHVDRNGGGDTTTHVSVKDGDNGTTFGFTIASDALMMSSTNRLEFGDTGTYIHQSADGVLDLVSDTEIEINATTIDINGAVAMDGAMTGGTNITISGELDAATLDISGNADIAGTTNLDAVDIDGNVQLDGTFTIGTDGSGQDVTFYSATSGDSFAWDASEEKLTITGTNGQTALDVADGNLVVADNIDLEGDIDVNGTANLDAVDIDGAVDMASTLVVNSTTTIKKALSSDTQSTPETVLKLGSTYTNTAGTDGAAGSGSRIEFQIPDDDTNPITGSAIAGLKENADDGVSNSALAFYVSQDDTTLDEALRIDSAGNIGIGATPTTFHADLTGVQIGGNGILQHETAAGASKTFKIAQNVREEITSGDFTYISTDEASLIELNSGGVTIKTAPSGTAGATATMTQRFSVSQAGAVTAPSTPAFLAHSSSDQSNIAEGTTITVVFDTEIFDQGSNFASNTFTAPVTGKYLLNFNIALEDIDSAADNYSITITTSNRTYTHFIFDPDFGQDNSFYNQAASVLADMDASDTAIVTVRQNGGSQQTDLGGGATKTFFSGYLAC